MAVEAEITRFFRCELENLRIGQRIQGKIFFLLGPPADEEDIPTRDVAQLAENDPHWDTRFHGKMGRRIAAARDDQDDFLDLATDAIREEIVAGRFRSTMAAPLGRGDAIAGSLTVVRSEVRPFNAGQYQIVVLSCGTSHGLQPGNVLRVWQAGEVADDNRKPGRISRNVRLPDEPAGLVIVFPTYDRVSYALVVQATGEIHELDRVRNPSWSPGDDSAS